MKSSPRILSASEWEAAQTLAPDHVPHVFKIDATTVAKTDLDEARAKAEVAAMELARRHTTIPIPKIYNCYRLETTIKWCILMEFVEGDVLQEVWDEADTESKRNIIQQLKGIMGELHAVKGQLVGTVPGGPCHDQFFDDLSASYGPFATASGFHDALIEALRIAQDNAWVDVVADFIQSLSTHHEVVLTHSDLTPRNIIVKEGKVAAIIDWELSGFYPTYWEYVKAYYIPDWKGGWIKERALDRILHPYPTELAVLNHAHRLGW